MYLWPIFLTDYQIRFKLCKGVFWARSNNWNSLKWIAQQTLTIALSQHAAFPLLFKRVPSINKDQRKSVEDQDRSRNPGFKMCWNCVVQSSPVASQFHSIWCSISKSCPSSSFYYYRPWNMAYYCHKIFSNHVGEEAAVKQAGLTWLRCVVSHAQRRVTCTHTLILLPQWQVAQST